MKKFLVLIAFVIFTLPVYAQVSLSGGNLGYTSFMDGFGLPGFVSDQYLYFTKASSMRDEDGDKLPGSNNVHNLMLLTSFKYIFEKPKILGAWPGISFTLPIMLDLEVDTERFEERETHFGDMFIGLFLQYPEVRLFGKVPFYQRFEILTKFPTGHYDSDNYVNAGNNAYAINPYYAFTMFLSKKLEFSARIFYKWTSKNNDPSTMPSPEWDPTSGEPVKFADDIQEGQAIWVNYAASYGVTDNLRLGINGYFLQMITDHKIDGHKIPDSKEKVFAIGPGAMYITEDKKNLYYLNIYHEAYVENRPKNDIALILRWIHVF